jgi:uncharacterized protein YjiS (DUF1127 family)
MNADTLPTATSQLGPAGMTTGPGQATPNHRTSLHARQTVGFVARWAAGLKRAWTRRKTIARLAALDNRLLADIGIERSQIGTVVDGVLQSVEAGAIAAVSAAHRITDGAGPPAINDNGPKAANNNRPEVEDSFAAVARQWRERRAAKATGALPRGGRL